MKRTKFLKHIRRNGCDLMREGAKHSVFWNPLNHTTSTIPRHTEITDILAEKICKDLGIPSP